MERAFGWSEQGGVSVVIAGTAGSSTQRFQRSFRGATVTVYETGTTTLATIYDDDNATPTAKANPFTANATTGFWYFYAVNGRYDVQFSGGGIATPFTVADIALGLGDNGGVNILRNSRFQVCTGLSAVTKMNTQSTGTMAALTCTANTTGVNLVTITTADTGQLKNGDLVLLAGHPDAAMTQHALRVSALVANTSFQVRLSLGRTASTNDPSFTATPQTVGDYTGSTGDGPDGWSKTTALDLWIEDGTVNLQTGSTRVVGLRKDGSGQETFRFVFSAGDLVQYRGKRIAFGMWVYQKIRGGSGTYRLYINDGTLNYSASGAAVASWRWLQVTREVATGATTLEIGISLDGATGDVYFVTQPCAVVAHNIPSEYYMQIPRELLIPVVGLTPVPWNNGVITFPAGADAGSTYSFIFDPYQETNGIIAPDVKILNLLVEGLNAGAAQINAAIVRSIAFRDTVTAPVKYGLLMPQVMQDVKAFGTGFVVLTANGQADCYSGIASDAWTNVSMDITTYVLN